MDRQSLLEQVAANFGGQNMNQGQQISFNQVTGDLGYSPMEVALELSKKQSIDAVNSSLGGFTQDSTSEPSATLKGFPITQAFGNRSGVEVFSHGVNTGVDVGVPKNTPVFLPKGKWKVLSAFNGAKSGYVGDNENQGYGNSVMVQNVDTGEKLRFSHLSSVNIPSEVMRGGQAVGLSGATGNVTGPHLDIEYHTPTGQLADFLKTSYASEVGL